MKDIFAQNLKNIFTYQPHKNYNFTISESENNNISVQEQNLNRIYNSVSVNQEYIKIKYNALVNSDIIIRNFSLMAKGKEYQAFLLYIDGMINSTMINDFILKPLMLRNKSNTYSDEDDSVAVSVSNNIIVRRRKKFSIENYIYNCLIPQNSITRESTFDKIISDVNSGNCALFIDTISTAFSIEVKGFGARQVSTPNNEIVVNGAQEAFVENIRTNTSLLRKIVNNENLIIEATSVGKITRTKVAICYMKNIANDELVAEVKYRINNLKIDSLISSRSTRPTYSR